LQNVLQQICHRIVSRPDCPRRWRKAADESRTDELRRGARPRATGRSPDCCNRSSSSSRGRERSRSCGGIPDRGQRRAEALRERHVVKAGRLTERILCTVGTGDAQWRRAKHRVSTRAHQVVARKRSAVGRPLRTSSNLAAQAAPSFSVKRRPKRTSPQGRRPTRLRMPSALAQVAPRDTVSRKTDCGTTRKGGEISPFDGEERPRCATAGGPPSRVRSTRRGPAAPPISRAPVDEHDRDSPASVISVKESPVLEPAHSFAGVTPSNLAPRARIASRSLRLALGVVVGCWRGSGRVAAGLSTRPGFFPRNVGGREQGVHQVGHEDATGRRRVGLETERATDSDGSRAPPAASKTRGAVSSLTSFARIGFIQLAARGDPVHGWTSRGARANRAGLPPTLGGIMLCGCSRPFARGSRRGVALLRLRVEDPCCGPSW